MESQFSKENYNSANKMERNILLPLLLLCLLATSVSSSSSSSSPLPPLAVSYGKSVCVFEEDLIPGPLRTYSALNAISALAYDPSEERLFLSDYGRHGNTAMYKAGQAAREDPVQLISNDEDILKLPTGMVLQADESALLVADSKRNAVVRMSIDEDILAEESAIQYSNGEKVKGIAYHKCSR